MTPPTTRAEPNNDLPRWTLGDRLRKARTHAGMTQEQIAVAIGCDASSVGNWETNSTKPRPIYLKQWSLVTGVPSWWIEIDNPDPGAESPSSVTARSRTQPAHLAAVA